MPQEQTPPLGESPDRSLPTDEGTPDEGAGRWRRGTVPRPPPSAILPVSPAAAPAPIPTRLSPLPRVAAALALAAVLALVGWLSLRPGTGAAPIFPHIDKLQHALAYAAVGALGVPAFRRVLPALALAVVWGGALEVLQGAVAVDRDASVSDALANTAGALAGVWASRSALRRRFYF